MSTETYTITSGQSRLSIDENGHLLSLSGNGSDWHGTPAPFWQMTLQAPSTPSVLGNHRKATPSAAPTIEQSGAQLVAHYADLQVEGSSSGIALDAVITAENGDFVFTFSVTNSSDSWSVREIRAPMITTTLPDIDRPALLWPNGAGERFTDPAQVGVQSVPYPTRLFVPWMALDAGDNGLYIASHDESLQAVNLNTDSRSIPDSIILSVGLMPFCGPGETDTTAPIVVRPYTGTWHEAAGRYRQWAETWFTQVERPSWVRDATGWQLVILKQQNGEIHWPYTDLDKLIELGKENGLNVLGLFGWTEGGHDRRYPIYDAEPAMGGEEALREGIQKAHAAGQKVILYTNGQLRDMLTDWHDEFGHKSAALSERGDSFGESWIKYKDAPPRRMTYGCQSSDIWSDTLLSFAKKIEALGADGLIFDQLGSCHPTLCFSTEHNHDKPSRAIGPGVAANMMRVQKEMQAINPDFIVIVEHVADGVNRHIDLTHGCGCGFAPGGRGFPEMLRYTFPEIWCTQRHPSPVMDRNTANWTCMYGFAHEVEYRYWPDRLYIEDGVAPEIVDYERIGATPNINLMRALDPREASAYLRDVTEFAQRNADVLREGTFRDTLGFTVDNQAVQAKAYVNGATTGIIVWNPTDEPQTVNVTVESAEFATADEPGSDTCDAADAIPPASIRLLRYSK